MTIETGVISNYVALNANTNTSRVKLTSNVKTRNLDAGRCSNAVLARLRDGEASVEVIFDFNEARKTVCNIRLPNEERPAQAPVAAPAPARMPVPLERYPGRPATAGDFHNPYNFVPTRQRPDQGELSDHVPDSLSRMHEDRFSGRMRVKWVAVTPLLVPDASRAGVTADDARHTTLPVRVDHDGHPYLAATSIKGVVRATVEALTNSRFGVANAALSKDRLGLRRTTQQARDLIPVQLVEVDGRLRARAYRGRRHVPLDGVMAAAWLPFYGHRVLHADGTLPKHGQEVVAVIERNRHPRGFGYDKVVSLHDANAQPVPGDGQFAFSGVVVVTGRGADNKHDERVFFDDRDGPEFLEIGQDAEEHWRALMEDSTALLREAQSSPGPEWPLHLTDPGRRIFGPGLLAYAEVEDSIITKLLPTTVSRDLHPESPRQRIQDWVRPAKTAEELSLADRLFGWVRSGNGEGPGALRGRVRITPSVGDKEVREFDMPLQILSTPKPQQGRFYLGKVDDTNTGLVSAHDVGLTKEQAGYRGAWLDKGGNHPRGFKVYPHHANRVDPPGAAEPYWSPTKDPLTTEFIRPRPTEGGDPARRDSQNRSIQGWVEPGTSFEFDVWVDNLTQVELGALCYVLWVSGLQTENEPVMHLRVGGGKPLGFGSVTTEIVGADIEGTATTRSRWSSWGSIERPPAERGRRPVIDAMKAFKDEMRARYGNENGFDAVPMVAALRAAAMGFPDNKPVHYPRLASEVDRDGLTYQWFVENDRMEHGQVRNAHPLQDLATDTGLPYFDNP